MSILMVEPTADCGRYVLSQLKALKLFGMATALAEMWVEVPRLALIPDDCLNRLIDAELAYRLARNLDHQLRGHHNLNGD